MGENNYVIVHLKLKIIASPEHFATFNGICKHSYICTRKHTHTPTKCQLTFELIANESESATEIIIDFNDFMKAFRRLRRSFTEYSASRKNNQKNIGWLQLFMRIWICMLCGCVCVFMRAFCRHFRGEFINTPIEVEI